MTSRRRHFLTGRGTSGEADDLLWSQRRETNGTLAFREAVDLLRRCGAAGAIVLLGVDGVLRGERRKTARLFAANVDTPLMIISVGSATTLARALPGSRGVSSPGLVVTLEEIAQIKHDGELLGTAAGSQQPPRRRCLAHAARLHQAFGTGQWTATVQRAPPVSSAAWERPA